MNLRRILAGLALACAGLAHAQFGVSTSGSITTQNLNATGTATASSCVALDITNKGTVAAQVSGTYTGALSAQRTADGATWETLSASTTFTNGAGTQTATIGSGVTGTFAIVNVAGFRAVRICGLAAVTGTATVVIYTAIPGGGSAGSSGGGGGGASTMADGADVAEGTTTDAACATDNGTCTALALLKRNNQRLTTIDTSINTAATTSAPVAPAAATATASTLIGGQYNSAGVTLTNGQQSSTQFDVSGNLKVVEPDLILGPYVSSADGVLFDIDTLGYESITVHTTTAGTGTHTFTTSHLQAATYVATTGYSPGTSGTTIAGSTIASAASVLVFPTTGRYFKDTISGYSVASTIYVRLSKKPVVSQIQAYVTNGGWQTQATSIGTNGLLTICDARTSITAVATAQGAREICTLDAKKIVLGDTIPELSWSYAAANTGITNTNTAVTIKAACTDRCYLRTLDLMCEALGTATEVAIRDGAAGTVLWRTKVGTGGLTSGRAITFSPPLRGTAATLMEVITLTASGTGACYVNASGYDAK